MPLTSTTTPIPTHYLLLLYPAHQLLDSAGPLDILSTLTKRPEGANITLTIASETLDPVPLAPIPPRTATWTFEDIPELPRAHDGVGFGGAEFDVQIQPHVTFDAVLQGLRKSEKGVFEIVDTQGRKVERSIDVLLIPGGIGTRMFRVDKESGERSSNVKAVVDFVRAVGHGRWIRSALLTVCTGSDLLARTGLLEGRRATTNAVAFEKVKERNVGVEWLRYRRWVRSLPEEVSDQRGAKGKGVLDKEIWTSAGISAGMDLMLWFLAEIYGMDLARNISRRLEYEWREHVGEGEVDPYYT